MFPYLALAKEKEWQPGPYEGVELKVLHKQPDTGGVVVLPELSREMLIGSSRNSPPEKPVCALAFIAESSDWMFGALTSMLPPVPPFTPPVVTI